jgi:hypothetical protein
LIHVFMFPEIELTRDRAAKLIAMVKGVSLDGLIPGRKADAMAQAAKLLAQMNYVA